jgi:putative salt-induced outer membrane protein YdiY
MFNRRGQVGEGLSFLLKLLLFMFITGAAVYIFNNVALSDIRAQNSARNLGTGFDSLALSSREITMEINCPSGVRFTIDGPKITARVTSAIGEGFASYSYMHEQNAGLPQKKILDCGLSNKIELSKSYDAAGIPTLEAVQ